ncbi:DUF7167 family protein [Sporosarcina sp. FA9]|uniref:DUF7167 family protein n=1 Tax=Sporosarcina sp. FA9 TaxID=3413030 RepID=UPI003F65DAA7
MKKHHFRVSISAGDEQEEIVELPSDMTKEEIEKEFKEWVWEQLDANYYEIK